MTLAEVGSRSKNSLDDRSRRRASLRFWGETFAVAPAPAVADGAAPAAADGELLILRVGWSRLLDGMLVLKRRLFLPLESAEPPGIAIAAAARGGVLCTCGSGMPALALRSESNDGGAGLSSGSSSSASPV